MVLCYLTEKINLYYLERGDWSNEGWGYGILRAVITASMDGSLTNEESAEALKILVNDIESKSKKNEHPLSDSDKLSLLGKYLTNPNPDAKILDLLFEFLGQFVDTYRGRGDSGQRDAFISPAVLRGGPTAKNLISRLVEHGVDINSPGDGNNASLRVNPLQWAAREGKKELVRYLLECGADPKGGTVNFFHIFYYLLFSVLNLVIFFSFSYSCFN